jgi:hypothetical protein
MQTLIRKLLTRLAPITVRVHWMDVVVTHKAHTRQEALEWMACYPLDAYIFVYTRFRLAAIRHEAI